MPHSLTIHPPQTHLQTDFDSTVSSPPPNILDQQGSGDESPVRPEYSPITPKVRPALPVTAPSTANTTFLPPDHGGNFTFSMSEQQQQAQTPPQYQSPPFASGGPLSQPQIQLDQQQQRQRPQQQQQQQPPYSSQPSKNEPVEMKPSPAQYIPQPPTQPFSSDDASDAIALRAAISTLQFQRRKAEDDLKTLARIKALALDQPQRFQAELAGGKLKEQRPLLGDLRAILDAPDTSDDEDHDDEEEMKGKEGEESANEVSSRKNAKLGTVETKAVKKEPTSETSPQPQAESAQSESAPRPPAPFPSIPGPQDVVRMPYVNWDKYGIVGQPLDAMHAQQQRCPGSTGASAERGREQVPAAPYSPFLDPLETQAKWEREGAAGGGVGPRKDSAAVASTPTATTSEHPMETRSRT